MNLSYDIYSRHVYELKGVVNGHQKDIVEVHTVGQSVWTEALEGRHIWKLQDSLSVLKQHHWEPYCTDTDSTSGPQQLKIYLFNNSNSTSFCLHLTQSGFSSAPFPWFFLSTIVWLLIDFWKWLSQMNQIMICWICKSSLSSGSLAAFFCPKWWFSDILFPWSHLAFLNVCLQDYLFNRICILPFCESGEVEVTVKSCLRCTMHNDTTTTVSHLWECDFPSDDFITLYQRLFSECSGDSRPCPCLQTQFHTVCHPVTKRK